MTGRKVRVVNNNGIGGSTLVLDADTGEQIKGVAYPVRIEVNESRQVDVYLKLTKVPFDMVGVVVGVKINEDHSYVEFDPATHDVIVKNNRVYFERKR